MRPPSVTLAFLHVPKCAGTTLTREILRKRFRGPSLLKFYEGTTRDLIRMLEGMSPSRQERIRCIAGHFAYGIHQFYRARPLQYMTILRDPVERLISHYRYVLRNPGHPLYGRVNQPGFTLKEYVESDCTPEVHNGQTRLLAGIGRVQSPGRGMLEAAIANLETHFPVVGMTEDFDGFVERLRRHMGWPELHYSNRNRSPEPSHVADLDSDTLAAVRRHNRLDEELVEYVRNRLAFRS